eukprot:GFUD01035395.1.p1 GENE.GFUD01035395.1~~GFUD01035395.1.p1  ORF type:complete len:269 (+),score=69.68 GFUD01035395.1:58-864(+)
MKYLWSLVSQKWSAYKFRFVPWLVFNMTDKTARHSTQMGDRVDQVDVLQSLESIFNSFEQYFSLKDDLTLYDELHDQHQDILRQVAGFSLVRSPSTVPEAGQGVFIGSGLAPAGRVVCLYPGTVYQPYQPVLIQSLTNQFIFRCVDGVHVDGSHGWLSRAIFRSCVGRDQVGLCRVADTSWLTPRPVNPLNVGQFVNNENSLHRANVSYHELDVPHHFPLKLRKFLGNIHFESSAIDGEREMRIVILLALRDICEGEELFSSYMTVIR